MMTLSEVSEKFNIPIRTLQKAAEDGRLPAKKSGGTWLVNVEKPEFKQFIDKYRPREEKK